MTRRSVIWWCVYAMIIGGSILVVTPMFATGSVAAAQMAVGGSVVLGATWGAIGRKYMAHQEPETPKKKWHYTAKPDPSEVWNYELTVYCGDTWVGGRSFDYWCMRRIIAREIRVGAWRANRKINRSEHRTF